MSLLFLGHGKMVEAEELGDYMIHFLERAGHRIRGMPGPHAPSPGCFSHLTSEAKA